MNDFEKFISTIEEISPKKEDKKYDPFDIFIEPSKDVDIKKIINDTNKINKAKNCDIMTCSECNGIIVNTQRGFECEQCGKIENIIEYNGDQTGSTDLNNSYNTSNNSATPIMMIGPNSYKFSKQIFYNNSNYAKVQKKNTVDQITNCVNQYKGKPPAKYIILEAAELYFNVQQFCIKRGDVRKGTMAACLYRICKKHEFHRKPKEIAEIFNIEQSELSNGEKILDELEVSCPINIPDETDEYKQIISFINRYFEILGIPSDELNDTPKDRPNYKSFVYNLVKFTQKKKIAESSIISSKTAGAIYILTRGRKELNISRDKIGLECNISKSTFNRFSQAVDLILDENYEYKHIRSQLRNIFKKHDVELPNDNK